MNFTQLHQQNPPLLLANVWDAASASAAQQAGYQALGTSSAAIAASLGYEDGEAMPFDEMLYIVSRIRSVSHLPLSVDIEAGYGQTVQQISHHIRRLAQCGVVGINLEDSHVVNGQRQLDDAHLFANKLSGIRGLLAAVDYPLFINVRTDTYLLNHAQALQETLQRGRLYHRAGADGFFVPGLTSLQDMAVISGQVSLPLNVMCMPALASFDCLAKAGVKRISMGNFVHSATQDKLNALLLTIQTQRSFAGVFLDASAG